jgi:hypothetical protein
VAVMQWSTRLLNGGTTLNTISLTVTAPAPKEEVFAFLAEIENLPKWATEFCQELKVVDGAYKVVSPGGELFIEYQSNPTTGVIDIFGGPTREEMGLFPMRVVPLPGGVSAVLVTMFQPPNTSDEVFRHQAESLQRELNALARNFEALKRAA